MKFVIVAAALLALCSLAHAQPTPKFEFGKAEEVKDVEETDRTGTIEAGLVFITGNSRTTTVLGAAKASRKQKMNKLSLEASATYAEASTIAVRGDLPPGSVLTRDDVTRVSKISAQSYAGKVRYDRFLTERNSLFVAGLVGSDVVGGKDFVGGGQLGYSRLLYKTALHEITGELGYDFSYETFVDPTAKAISIHSARAFVGYKGKLSDDTSVDGLIELLGNVNRQSDDVGPMKDIRGTGSASLSTKLSKSVSFAFSLTGKFDNVPAPFSLAGYMIDPTNPPEALKFDTTTKASLIVAFL